MISHFIYLFVSVNVVWSLRCYKSSPSNCFSNVTCKYQSIECQHSSSPSQNRGGMYCTTVIQKENDQIRIGTMDCIYDQETTKKCFNQSQCLMKYTNDQKQFLHCCCDQNLCNLNFNLSDPDPIQIPSDQLTNDECQGRFCHRIYWIIGLSLLLIFFGIFLLTCLFCRKTLIGNFKKCRKSSRQTNVDDLNEKSMETNPFLIENSFEINSNLIEIKHFLKQGKYSRIEKGFFQNEEIIFKTFTNEKQSKSLFENEIFIYSLLSIEHKNILKYYGYTKDPIYRILFEYCPNGTLKEYLKKNFLENEIDLLNMFKELSEGLYYLHKDFRHENENKRAPIAHRDLKSENILFFHFHRLVICDFAMSTQIQQYQYGLNNQQQIGTPRYMSPELLIGTIGCDEGALLKCDVYALGILFWEILSRFDFQNSDVNKYKLPFEDQLRQLGSNVNNPTIAEMNKILDLSPPENRPLIHHFWKNSKLKSFDSIFSLLDQCWNQDPNLRIHAGVVLNRINSIIRDYSSI